MKPWFNEHEPFVRVSWGQLNCRKWSSYRWKATNPPKTGLNRSNALKLQKQNQSQGYSTITFYTEVSNKFQELCTAVQKLLACCLSLPCLSAVIEIDFLLKGNLQLLLISSTEFRQYPVFLTKNSLELILSILDWILPCAAVVRRTKRSNQMVIAFRREVYAKAILL